MQAILGKIVQRPATLDQNLAQELKALSLPGESFKTVLGKTMSVSDFYEGQARLDGAFCEYTDADKMEYLMKLKEAGVVNIEMESLEFAALTHLAGIKAAVICISLIDRLNGDQVIGRSAVVCTKYCLCDHYFHKSLRYLISKLISYIFNDAII